MAQSISNQSAECLRRSPAVTMLFRSGVAAALLPSPPTHSFWSVAVSKGILQGFSYVLFWGFCPLLCLLSPGISDFSLHSWNTVYESPRPAILWDGFSDEQEAMERATFSIVWSAGLFCQRDEEPRKYGTEKYDLMRNVLLCFRSANEFCGRNVVCTRISDSPDKYSRESEEKSSGLFNISQQPNNM